MTLSWRIENNPPADDLAVIAHGVFSHGRAQAAGGNASPISCLVRDNDRVVAGGSGRTEYRRLFISYLWVTEELRGHGIARRILSALETEAANRGCHDSLIETLDDSVARLYSKYGYKAVAVLSEYVGPFNRHIMIKSGINLPPNAEAITNEAPNA